MSIMLKLNHIIIEIKTYFYLYFLFFLGNREENKKRVGEERKLWAL